MSTCILKKTLLTEKVGSKDNNKEMHDVDIFVTSSKDSKMSMLG